MLKGGGIEQAAIQSVCASVLPEAATTMLQPGDTLVSVNGHSVRRYVRCHLHLPVVRIHHAHRVFSPTHARFSFREQLEEIKRGSRPIWLGFSTHNA